MTDEELQEWDTLRKQWVNGYHLSDWDKKTLIQLNHLVMEQAHNIHNDSMMNNFTLKDKESCVCEMCQYKTIINDGLCNECYQLCKNG